MGSAHNIGYHEDMTQPDENLFIQAAPLPHQRLALARRLALLLDSAFEIPGTRQRVGLDPILGLVPGLGDLVGLGIALYILYVGRQVGVSHWRQGQMLLNIILDTAIGAIPVVGDTFDLFWKSNQRNLNIIERHVEKHHGPAPAQSVMPKRRGFGLFRPMPSRRAPGVPMPPGRQTIEVEVVAQHPQTGKS